MRRCILSPHLVAGPGVLASSSSSSSSTAAGAAQTVPEPAGIIESPSSGIVAAPAPASAAEDAGSAGQPAAELPAATPGKAGDEQEEAREAESSTAGAGTAPDAHADALTDVTAQSSAAAGQPSRDPPKVRCHVPAWSPFPHVSIRELVVLCEQQNIKVRHSACGLNRAQRWVAH
jgi:hypothetical protein